MAKALNTIEDLRLSWAGWRKSANRRTDIETIAPRQQRDEISGSRGGNTTGPFVRQRANQCGQSHDSPSLGISARLVASCQGSTLSRASAERTLRPVPFRSAPIGAQRNSSNSGPMRTARAGWVTAIPDPFLFTQRRGRRPTPLKAPSELLDPGPIRGRAFGGGPCPAPATNRSMRCPSRRHTGQNCC
jgi:hypothetical protein